MGGVFIGVGSNIDPAPNIRKALALLDSAAPILNLSTFYITEPECRPGQPRFYNGALEIETDLHPRALKFDLLRNIETDLGRIRTADAHAPRTIDLDILVHKELVIREEDLVIPDPQIKERPFIALPLHELAPELVLPGSGVSLAGFAARFENHGMTPLVEFTDTLRMSLK